MRFQGKMRFKVQMILKRSCQHWLHLHVRSWVAFFFYYNERLTMHIELKIALCKCIHTFYLESKSIENLMFGFAKC